MAETKVPWEPSPELRARMLADGQELLAILADCQRNGPTFSAAQMAHVIHALRHDEREIAALTRETEDWRARLATQCGMTLAAYERCAQIVEGVIEPGNDYETCVMNEGLQIAARRIREANGLSRADEAKGTDE